MIRRIHTRSDFLEKYEDNPLVQFCTPTVEAVHGDVRLDNQSEFTSMLYSPEEALALAEALIATVLEIRS